MWRAQSPVWFELHLYPHQPASETLAEQSHLQTSLTLDCWWFIPGGFQILCLFGFCTFSISQKNCLIHLWNTEIQMLVQSLTDILDFAKPYSTANTLLGERSEEEEGWNRWQKNSPSHSQDFLWFLEVIISFSLRELKAKGLIQRQSILKLSLWALQVKDWAELNREFQWGISFKKVIEVHSGCQAPGIVPKLPQCSINLATDWMP